MPDLTIAAAISSSHLFAFVHQDLAEYEPALFSVWASAASSQGTWRHPGLCAHRSNRPHLAANRKAMECAAGRRYRDNVTVKLRVVYFAS